MRNRNSISIWNYRSDQAQELRYDTDTGDHEWGTDDMARELSEWAGEQLIKTENDDMARERWIKDVNLKTKHRSNWLSLITRHGNDDSEYA